MSVFATAALSQQHPQAVLPPDTIDGSVTPELIPDIVACRLFFTAASAAPHDVTASASHLPSPVGTAESPRQRAKLHPAELNSDDEAALVAILADFRASLDSIQISGTSLNDLAQQTLDLLQARMSPDGYQRLLQHIRSEKKKMKMIPFPDMSAHSH